MGGMGGVSPFSILTADLSTTLSASIRPWQILSGAVVVDGDGLGVALRGSILKLPAGAFLPPGTRVAVHVQA